MIYHGFKAFRKYNGRALLHVFYIEEPHPSSFAASLLLQEQYKEEDELWVENKTHRELCKAGKLNFSTIRRVFFTRLLKNDGRLHCYMCGKDGLLSRCLQNTRYKIGKREMRKLPKSSKIKITKNLATIDHVVPLSEGGPKYSLKNMMCLCNDCNNLKGSKRVIITGNGIILNG